MLKKQTVWLLTMLSLIIVLSVYALTSTNETNQADTDGPANGDEVTADPQEAVKATAAQETLAEISVKKADERNDLHGEYQSVIASEDSSTKEVSAAYDKLEELQTLANNEMILEETIRQKGYKDAVIKTDGREIQIFVGAGKLSDQQANELIQLANQYIGTGRVVSVNYAVGR